MKKKITLYLCRSGSSELSYVSMYDMSPFNDKLMAPPVPVEIDFNLYDDGVLRQKEIKEIDKQIDQ